MARPPKIARFPNQNCWPPIAGPGANAWRTAHEPPADDLLKAADRLGFLVWLENREFGTEDDGFLPQGPPSIPKPFRAVVYAARSLNCH